MPDPVSAPLFPVGGEAATRVSLSGGPSSAERTAQLVSLRAYPQPSGSAHRGECAGMDECDFSESRSLYLCVHHTVVGSG